MKTLTILWLIAVASAPTLAQQPLHYTIWADGVLNAQLPKSSLYGLGAGLRGEISKPLGQSRGALFVQAGYTRFFEKAAFTANIGLVSVGYRYQSRKVFGASVGVGAQYWSERMRIRFPDYTIDETLNNVIPSATVGLSMRINAHYRLGLENRVLVKPERGTVLLRNLIALSVGYTR